MGVNFLIFGKVLLNSFYSFYGKNLISDVKLGKLWGNFEKLRTEAIEFSGWSQKDNIDLSLDPQSQGIAVYKFIKPKESKAVILQLAIAHPEKGSNKVSISTDQTNWKTIIENKRLHLIPIDITKYVNNNEGFWIKIEAVNNNPQLASKPPPAVILYDFYLMFYRHQIEFSPILIIVFLALNFFPILLIIKPNKKKILQLSLFFLVFSVGLYSAAHNLYINRYHSFDNDIICLIQETPRFLALDFKNAFLGNYCGNKESIIMYIFQFFWKIFGFESEMGIRVSSVFFHLMTIILVFWYGKKIKSFTTGLIAALFIGTQTYLIELSTRGLRDTAFTFFITVFAYLLFETNLKKLKNIVSIITIGILTIYLRLHSLLQLVSITLFFSFLTKKIIAGLLIIIFLIITALPLIQNNLKVYKTWNYSESMHLKWNTNVEFAGKPGFPSKESVTINPFQGPEISNVTYFFKFHSLPDLVISTLKGVGKAFVDLYFKNNNFGLILFLAGAWLMIQQKKYWYILFLIFWLEVPHFFLVTKNLVEYRSMTQSLPFISLVIGYIIDRIWQRLKQ